MNDSLIIRPKPPETCGGCKYGRILPRRLDFVECCGTPPTLMFFGQAEKDLAGNIGPKVELMRPNVPASLPACALWKPRSTDPADLTVSSETMGRG